MMNQLKSALGLGGSNRSPEEQQRVEREAQKLTLYHFPSCPFCMRTRQKIKELGLPIREKDINRDPDAREELIEGGGKKTVPCLRIDADEGTRWMYESADINAWLEEHFSPA